MRKEFMKAAKCVGKYLSVAALSFALVACGGEASAENGQNAKQETVQEQTLPFPQFPASIEEAEYNGQKGCVAINDKTSLVLGAIMSNEGLMLVGGMSLMETTTDGAHAFRVLYNNVQDYGYILANKAEGSFCVINKLTNMSFKNTGNFQTVSHGQQGKYTTEQCNFTPRFGQICGTFGQVSGALKKNGFAIDWQGEKQNGDVLTLLSNDKKSYYLTTDDVSGATVVTGVGDYAFEYDEVPTKMLIAKHP